MDAAGVEYVRQDNCFPWIAGWAKAQRLMDRQRRAHWPKLLDGVARQLNPVHREIFRKHPVSYYWRLIAAAESEAIGYGGVSAVARATGVLRRAITGGMKELSQRKTARKAPHAQVRIRREGAGRKRAVDKDPGLLEDLDRLVDPVTRGDREFPLRRTCMSVRRLAEELQQEGHAVGYQTVAELLLNAAQGAGIQAGKRVVELGVDGLITGRVRPKAFSILQARGIRIYTGASGSVTDAIEQFKAGKLAAAASADVDGHWA